MMGNEIHGSALGASAVIDRNDEDHWKRQNALNAAIQINGQSKPCKEVLEDAASILTFLKGNK